MPMYFPSDEDLVGPQGGRVGPSGPREARVLDAIWRYVCREFAKVPPSAEYG
jgi:hypothetical protein